MINQLITQAEKKQVTYLPFQFPLGVNTERTKLVFSFNGFENEYLLTKDAMTHLLQHLRVPGGEQRRELKDLYYTNLSEFVNQINLRRTMQEHAELWRKDQTYILAVNGFYVHGIIANYNPKSNADVLRDIEQYGFDVRRAYITAKEMNLYIEHTTQSGYELGINVRNGETGFVTLSYRLYVYNKQGDYTFSTPAWGRRKHLSLLEKVDDDLNDLYAEIQDIDFHDYILNTESKTYAEIILSDDKFEKLWDIAQRYDTRLRKVYQLLGDLHAKSNERGYKTVCNKALDELYSNIMEEI